MAGIFGACNFDNRPIDRQMIARMSDTLAHRGPDGGGLVFEGAFALGCRLRRVTSASRSETQPVLRPTGTRLAFDGRLDNRHDLIATLRHRHDVSAATPDAELVACAYDAFGVDFASRLLGDFSVAVLDPRERRVVLARDAIGIRPLYYRRTPASLTFASEMKTLLADPDVEARPNDKLLAELLLGHLHRHDDDGATMFDGIHGLQPAHVGIFNATQSVTRRYWDFSGHPAASRQSFEECAEGFRYHFQRAVERRLRSASPVAVTVSGGLDSSSIFCVASRSAGTSPLVGLTYTTRDGGAWDESRFVGEVEIACGRSIRDVEPPLSAGLLFRSDELIRRVETPMMNAQWWVNEQLLMTVAAAGAGTLLTGHWGDQILFDQAYLVDLLHAGDWRTIRSHLNGYPEWFSDASSGEFRRRFCADLLEYDLPRWVRLGLRAARNRWRQPAPWDDWYTERFRREAGPDVFSHDLSATALNGDTGHSPTILARALYREVRSKYHGVCFEWNDKMAAAHGIERALPFLDRDLVEFVMGVPGSILARDGVPKALLRAALEGVVPAPVLQRRSKGDFTAQVNDASRHDYAAIVDMLGPDALVVQFGYVDADKLRTGLRALEGTLQGSASCIPSWRLTGVVAFELWLQGFLGTTVNNRREQHGKTPLA